MSVNLALAIAIRFRGWIDAAINVGARHSCCCRSVATIALTGKSSVGETIHAGPVRAPAPQGIIGTIASIERTIGIAGLRSLQVAGSFPSEMRCRQTRRHTLLASEFRYHYRLTQRHFATRNCGGGVHRRPCTIGQ